MFRVVFPGAMRFVYRPRPLQRWMFALVPVRIHEQWVWWEWYEVKFSVDEMGDDIGKWRRLPGGEWFDCLFG